MEASSRVPARQPSGWTVFTGAILLIVGLLDFFWGLAAILNGEVVAVGGHGVIWISTTFWGWIQLLLGVVVAGTGLMLFGGSPTARMLALFLIALNAVSMIVWFPLAPLWALLIIALDVTLIYQLAARWEE